ncbi:hypothetical protein [Brucella cytisi]|uniref:Transposase n=1 Tax=Brucella cytisi TaxID=407152 RepID=A0A1J6HWW7_9HYPH|nr:hypothetical protein [Brucella cytisi]OIS92719.1 hypothetical protein BLA27_14860 [Brucella cytisi]
MKWFHRKRLFGWIFARELRDAPFIHFAHDHRLRAFLDTAHADDAEAQLTNCDHLEASKVDPGWCPGLQRFCFGHHSATARQPRMLVAVALADETARIIWALMLKQEEYITPVAAAV